MHSLRLSIDYTLLNLLPGLGLQLDWCALITSIVQTPRTMPWKRGYGTIPLFSRPWHRDPKVLLPGAWHYIDYSVDTALREYKNLLQVEKNKLITVIYKKTTKLPGKPAPHLNKLQHVSSHLNPDTPLFIQTHPPGVQYRGSNNGILKRG